MRTIEFVKRVYEERKRYFDDWKRYTLKIKEVAMRELGEAEVYVFGSLVEGEVHPALSDIDILIVSSNAALSNDGRAKIIAKIRRELGALNPFEIHLASPKEFEWYRNFVSKLVRVE